MGREAAPSKWTPVLLTAAWSSPALAASGSARATTTRGGRGGGQLAVADRQPHQVCAGLGVGVGDRVVRQRPVTGAVPSPKSSV